MAHAILLALAGLATGGFWLLPLFRGRGSILGAILLGVVLAAYLRLHGGIRSGPRLAGVVLATVGGYVVMMFVGIATVLVSYVTSSGGQSTNVLASSLGGALGAAVVALAFLQVLPSQRDRLGLEIACCAIAGGLVGWLPAIAAAYPLPRWLLQMNLWNGAVAAALALVSCLRARPAGESTTTLRLAAVGGIVMIFGMLVFAPQLRAVRASSVTSTVVEPPYVAAIRAANLASLKEAPPLIELPETFASAQDIFNAKPPVDFKCFPPTVGVGRPYVQEIESLSLQLPSRRMYRLQCHPTEEFPSPTSSVQVGISEYPNEAWATYEMRFNRSNVGQLQERRAVQRILKKGRPVFAVAHSRTYWSSGDKIVEVSGSASRETLDVFIDAYLKRYPNTLEPDFDLLYRPPTQ